MPRFVILRHQTPADYPRPAHFDLMLEHDGVLWTWALERLPASGELVVAERLSDHRLTFLEYEGEIAGNRGNVRRVEEGVYEWLEQSVGELKIGLRGAEMEGTLRLALVLEEPRKWNIVLSEK